MSGSNGIAVDKQRTNNGKQLGGCTGKGFMPGESGNPNGRPKGTGLTDRLRAILENDGCKVAQEIVDAGVKAARDGDFRFWNAIFERIDGKVQENIKADGSLEIVVRYVDKPVHHGDSDD